MDMQQALEIQARNAEQRKAFGDLTVAFNKRQALVDQFVNDLAKIDEEITTLRRSAIRISNNSQPSQLTNVEVYEAILRENGEPMHARDILKVFRDDYGRELRGLGNPVEQVRLALRGCKTFTNLGDNTWWLAEAVSDGPTDAY